MSEPDLPRIDVPDFKVFRLRPDPSPMVPAEPRRKWMDATNQRFAYRCIPMPIANATGWELLSPIDFKVGWSGGNDVDALTVTATKDEDSDQVRSFISSHFGLWDHDVQSGLSVSHFARLGDMGSRVPERILFDPAAT